MGVLIIAMGVLIIAIGVLIIAIGVLIIAIGVLIIAIGTCKRQGRRRFQSSRGRGCRTPLYRVRSTQHRPEYPEYP